MQMTASRNSSHAFCQPYFYYDIIIKCDVLMMTMIVMMVMNDDDVFLL